MKLNIEKKSYSPGLDAIKITGFSEGELSELKSMEHKEAEQTLLDMLDHRNNNYGSALACGYGVYGLWFDNEAAYMTIGNSCD